MDWFPIFNSLRVAVIATALVFFPALLAAHRVTRLSLSPVRSVFDVILTLPLVLPPPAIGWLVLRVLGPRYMFGYWMRQLFNVRLVATWQIAVLTSARVSFPLMYRTARAAFERFDPDLSDVARTLGRPDNWIFWHIQLPVCRDGVAAGAVLTFARALGEYGATVMAAGYSPASTATVSTNIYHLWSVGDPNTDLWVLLSVLLSGACLIVVSALEGRQRGGEAL